MASDERRPPARRNSADRRPGGTRPAAAPRGADRLLALDPKARRPRRGRRAGAGRSAGGPSRSRSRRFVGILGIVGTVVVLLAASVLGYTYWRYRQLKRVDLGLTKAAAGAPQNYLIVGSDTRQGISKSDPNAGAYLGPGAPDANSSRSDTIMILRIDPKQTKAQLLSLPRDLYVPIAGTQRSDRINSAFGRGRQVLTDTIQQYLDITINHYVEVDFVGFRKIVDAIGGVDMYFQVPVRDAYTGLDVTEPGCKRLDGEQALNLARSRHLYYFQKGRWHYDGASDLSRISRQQTLIRRAIPKATRAAVNPVKLNSLADTVVNNVTVDKNMGVGALIDLAQQFRHFDAQHLTTYSLPTKRYFTPSGDDVLKLESSDAQPVLDVFRGVDPARSAQRAFGVRVLNGSGADAQAANVAGALERVGFRVSGMGNSSELGLGHVESTQIRFAPGDEADADRLASFLTVEAELKPIAGAESGTLVLVTGDDFTTVRTEPKAVATTAPETAAPSTVATTSTTTTLPVYIPGPAPEGESCG